MKALVYTAPHQMTYQDYKDPTLVDGEVIIKVHAVGICGSDMHAFHGHDPRRLPGLIMGHELAGEIVESGSPLYKKGDRVTINPIITCGHCEYCLQGRDNLCSNRTMVGMQREGAYAEYMSIPAQCVIPLGDKISYRDATITEPAANAVHALGMVARALHRPIAEAKSLVVGGGAIGLLFALLMKHYGCRNITMAETNDLRRDMLSQYIDCDFVNPLKENVEENSFDFAVDAVGMAPTRNLAIASLKPGATLLHIGLQDWSSEIDMRKITLAELKVLGTYCYTHADLCATVKAIEEGAFGTLDWVQECSMAEGPKAFDDLSAGRIASPKVVLTPWS